MPPLVHFRPTKTQVRVDSGTTLHAAVRRAGLPIASACGADGLCGRCGLHVLRGKHHLSAESTQERRVKERNRIDPSTRLGCYATLDGDVEISASYW